jgi:hypothetical protein
MDTERVANILKQLTAFIFWGNTVQERALNIQADFSSKIVVKACHTQEVLIIVAFCL